MHMDAPNDELLAKIHKVTLYILLAFDKVCRDNNLTYFLDSGTALGAVRHGGFIPWDDDADVGMPRKDYERFLEIGQEKLSKEFFIQTRETDPAYNRNAAKLRLNGTIFEEIDDLQNGHKGIFIDIFPFDNIPRNNILANIDLTISRVLFYIVRSWYETGKSPSLFRRLIVTMFIKRFSEVHINHINDLYVRYCRKYEDCKTSKITCYYWCMSQYKTYTFKTSKMFPVKEIIFEGHPLKIAQDYDYYLKKMYGDYMTPVSSNKRVLHLKGKIDFGQYA